MSDNAVHIIQLCYQPSGMFLEIKMLTYQAGVQVGATVVHIVTFYTSEGALYVFQR
jgi:hypothetical protein